MICILIPCCILIQTKCSDTSNYNIFHKKNISYTLVQHMSCMITEEFKLCYPCTFKNGLCFSSLRITENTNTWKWGSSPTTARSSQFKRPPNIFHTPFWFWNCAQRWFNTTSPRTFKPTSWRLFTSPLSSSTVPYLINQENSWGACNTWFLSDTRNNYRFFKILDVQEALSCYLLD